MQFSIFFQSDSRFNEQKDLAMLARIRIMRTIENFVMFCLTRKNIIESKITERT